jgi:hypothetical protein
MARKWRTDFRPLRPPGASHFMRFCSNNSGNDECSESKDAPKLGNATKGCMAHGLGSSLQGVNPLIGARPPTTGFPIVQAPRKSAKGRKSSPLLEGKF